MVFRSPGRIPMETPRSCHLPARSATADLTSRRSSSSARRSTHVLKFQLTEPPSLITFLLALVSPCSLIIYMNSSDHMYTHTTCTLSVTSWTTAVKCFPPPFLVQLTEHSGTIHTLQAQTYRTGEVEHCMVVMMLPKLPRSQFPPSFSSLKCDRELGPGVFPQANDVRIERMVERV